MVLFIFILFFAGCKKDNQDAGYYFSATINGKKYRLDINLMGALTTATDTTDGRFKVFGKQGVLNDSANMQLIIQNYSHENVTNGTYPRKNFYVYFFYNDGHNFGAYQNGPTLNNSTIVLTEMTDSYVEGTFSGVLYGYPDDSLKVTNGKFKAPLAP